MSLLTLWPTMSNDTGDSVSGTTVNKTLFDDIKTAIEDHTHSSTNTTVKPKDIIDEVVTARGASANLDARLDAMDTSIAGVVVAGDIGDAEGALNLAGNSDFRDWGAGTTSAPNCWTLAGAGATIVRTGTGQADTSRRVGDFAAAVTFGSATATLLNNIISAEEYARRDHLDAEEVVVGAWVRTSVASQCRLHVDDGSTISRSSFHTGGGAYEFLSVSHVVSNSATKLDAGFEVVLAGTGYISGLVVLHAGTVPTNWSQGSEKQNLYTGTRIQFETCHGYTNTLGLANTVIVSSANVVQVYLFWLPFRMRVESLVIQLGTVSAGNFCGFGVYSLSGDRLLTSGAVSTAVAGRLKATASYTLEPGFYYSASTANNAVAAAFGHPPVAGTIYGTHVTAAATAANASAAGVLPATLGALTLGATNPFMLVILNGVDT